MGGHPGAGASYHTEVLDDLDAAPTPYGRTDPGEAFAEAFSLYYADPDALERASPEAFASFEAGHHIPAKK